MKNLRGRPPKYKTVAELQAKIDEYFELGVEAKEIAVGPPNNRKIELIKTPTLTGLVLWLGFCSRDSFYEYGKKPEFTDSIKRARTRIEQTYEEQLHTGTATGAIFALKNFGWIDTPVIDQTVHYHLTHEYRAKPKDSFMQKRKDDANS